MPTIERDVMSGPDAPPQKLASCGWLKGRSRSGSRIWVGTRVPSRPRELLVVQKGEATTRCSFANHAGTVRLSGEQMTGQRSGPVMLGRLQVSKPTATREVSQAGLERMPLRTPNSGQRDSWSRGFLRIRRFHL